MRPPLRCGRRRTARSSVLTRPLGRASLILFKSLVRPPLRCGRCRTARSSVLTRPQGGSYSSYLDHWCDLRYAAVATGLLYECPYPPCGRTSLILFKSLVRPPLRCGRCRTDLWTSFPTLRAGVTHLKNSVNVLFNTFQLMIFSV